LSDARRTDLVRACVALAEDDEEFRAFLALRLREAGFDVLECATGLGLLRLLAARDGEEELEPIDLVISDLRMPGASGIDVLASRGLLVDCPPFILITAFGDAATSERALSLGADAVLDKPFDPDLLVLRAWELVRRWDGPQAGERPWGRGLP
jgi:DNA-binding response OmpR family regulator